MGALNKQFKEWADRQVEQDSQANLTCGINSYCEHLRKLIEDFQHLFLSAPLRPMGGKEPVEIPETFVQSIKFKREIETLNSDFTKWYCVCLTCFLMEKRVVTDSNFSFPGGGGVYGETGWKGKAVGEGRRAGRMG